MQTMFTITIAFALAGVPHAMLVQDAKAGVLSSSDESVFPSQLAQAELHKLMDEKLGPLPPSPPAPRTAQGELEASTPMLASQEPVSASAAAEAMLTSPALSTGALANPELVSASAAAAEPTVDTSPPAPPEAEIGALLDGGGVWSNTSLDTLVEDFAAQKILKADARASVDSRYASYLAAKNVSDQAEKTRAETEVAKATTQKHLSATTQALTANEGALTVHNQQVASKAAQLVDAAITANEEAKRDVVKANEDAERERLTEVIRIWREWEEKNNVTFLAASQTALDATTAATEAQETVDEKDRLYNEAIKTWTEEVAKWMAVGRDLAAGRKVADVQTQKEFNEAGGHASIAAYKKLDERKKAQSANRSVAYAEVQLKKAQDQVVVAEAAVERAKELAEEGEGAATEAETAEAAAAQRVTDLKDAANTTRTAWQAAEKEVAAGINLANEAARQAAKLAAIALKKATAKANEARALASESQGDIAAKKLAADQAQADVDAIAAAIQAAALKLKPGMKVKLKGAHGECFVNPSAEDGCTHGIEICGVLKCGSSSAEDTPRSDYVFTIVEAQNSRIGFGPPVPVDHPVVSGGYCESLGGNAKCPEYFCSSLGDSNATNTNGAVSCRTRADGPPQEGWGQSFTEIDMGIGTSELPVIALQGKNGQYLSNPALGELKENMETAGVDEKFEVECVSGCSPEPPTAEAEEQAIAKAAAAKTEWETAVTTASPVTNALDAAVAEEEAAQARSDAVKFYKHSMD